MPLYVYRCPVCSWSDEISKPMSASDTTETCRQCGQPMERDYRAEIRTSNSDTYGARAIHSDALAINPGQVEEHHRLYPNIKLDEKCRPVLENYHDHNAYIEARGVVKQSHLREY